MTISHSEAALAPRKHTLWEVVDDLITYLDTLDACTTEEQREQVEREMMQAMDAVVRKVDGFAAHRKQLDAAIAAAKAEKERLSERLAYLESAKKRLDGYAVRVMEVHGVQKLSGKVDTLYLQRSPASVDVFEPSSLPDEFVRTTVTVEPNKAEIRRALESGQRVPGARLVTDRLGLRVK